TRGDRVYRLSHALRPAVIECSQQWLPHYGMLCLLVYAKTHPASPPPPQKKTCDWYIQVTKPILILADSKLAIIPTHSHSNIQMDRNRVPSSPPSNNSDPYSDWPKQSSPERPSIPHTHNTHPPNPSHI
ncbi:hypothetical protein KUCAC02_007025, partial [Chaenocephalus aceratus]